MDTTRGNGLTESGHWQGKNLQFLKLFRFIPTRNPGFLVGRKKSQMTAPLISQARLLTRSGSRTVKKSYAVLERQDNVLW
ncbi:hypothetical protein IF2G_05689 [Cordyceps javanica]|nr:hypothetical protein IF2G_05689 [Cordyceps javanica]